MLIRPCFWGDTMKKKKRPMGYKRVKTGRKRRKAAGRRGLFALFMLFFVLFLVFFCLFLRSWLRLSAEKRDFAELANIAEETAQTEAEAPDRFSILYEKNNDLIGWISIDDTKIDYPVMLTPEDPDFYLDHNFEKNAAQSGVPFFGEGCTPESDNIIIYGHHMKNGTMFADLLRYQEEDFGKNHPFLSFETREGTAQYVLLAAFREKTHYQDETGVFRYYDYGGELTEEQFAAYLQNIKALSCYDTGITATYGEQLLTLSTCSYHTENGRFVVVAKRMDGPVS